MTRLSGPERALARAVADASDAYERGIGRERVLGQGGPIRRWRRAGERVGAALATVEAEGRLGGLIEAAEALWGPKTAARVVNVGERYAALRAARNG